MWHEVDLCYFQVESSSDRCMKHAELLQICLTPSVILGVIVKGLVAFSEHGLMIRWWSLGSVWWEKLSRNLAPVQCTKLIFVPPWEGFSPNSSRSSIMASILGHDNRANLQDKAWDSTYADNLKFLMHNLDLSYQLQWVGERKVLLSRHGLELGAFPL
ncbi:hypothetical protein NC652_001107 [Populus alba x Populus x berolinensis]|nr:hypothetical protein NC652_001107 [Populus alba x Populus x berolinensis]